MRALKKLFTSTPYLPAHQLTQQYLSVIRIQSNSQLPLQYATILTQFIAKCQKPNQFLNELLKQFRLLNNHESLIKLITIIHHLVIEMKYNKENIKDLEDLDLHSFDEKTHEKWFIEFYQCYITYLIKLPSLADVYEEALQKEHNVAPELHLTHIFRLTNTVRVLFPTITNAVNIVGRYQATKYPTMKELFVILSGELVKIYSYIKYICDQILRQYRVYNPKDLQCFIQTLPQLQLFCDKIQDLLLNKYLKGKKISSKIEFKQQKIAQVQYYLAYQYNADSEKLKNILPQQ